MPRELAPMLVHFQAQFDAHLKDLETFVGIARISTNTLCATQRRKGAVWLQDRLVRAGITETALVETSHSAVVLGRHLHRDNAPTFVIYRRYAVDPPASLEHWATPPFSLTQVGERLYSRAFLTTKRHS